MTRAPLALAALAALALAVPTGQAADAPGAATQKLVPVQPYPGTAAAPAADAALAPPALEPTATTAIYVYPTSPSTFVPVVGLPSFVVQPGAPVPEVATYVVHSVVVPHWAERQRPLGDLDCSNFDGTVRVIPPDVNHLDPDGNGIGCEPHER